MNKTSHADGVMQQHSLTGLRLFGGLSATFPSFLMALLLVLSLSRSSMADPTFSLVTWGTPANTETWVDRAGGDADLVANPSGDYLATTFNAAGVPTFESDIFQTIDSGWVGNYDLSPDWLTVSFSFQGYASSAQSLYFETVGGSSWSYTFTSSSHAWETENISFQSVAGWTQLSGSESFSTSLGAVSLIGISVEHLNTGTAFEYGLDNWQFNDVSPSSGVPEPGTWITIGTALIPAASMLRNRFRKRSAVQPEAVA
jgi:hypothetical protein